ncbi:MAG TPA: hypothetical protein VNH53_05020 [Sphingomicrobium sp.]|nr:hypothetical protein [Sphingomicrobium sp.]
MMRKTRILFAAVALSLPLGGCASAGVGEGFSRHYTLVGVRSVSVGDGSMAVTPPRPWNRQRPRLFDDIRQVEDWTLNGPLLDGMSFVTGLRNRQHLIRQRSTEDRQVPMFRSDMTAPEVTAMIESLFRVRGGAVDFRTTALAPHPFLGANGFQWDYEHLDSDELWRRGRAVGAVIDGRLYMILFDAARSHYYQNAIGDFEALVASARRRR